MRVVLFVLWCAHHQIEEAKYFSAIGRGIRIFKNAFDVYVASILYTRQTTSMLYARDGPHTQTHKWVLWEVAG